MILYEKLKRKYGEDLKEKLSENLYNRILNRKSFYLQEIARCGMDLEEVRYTFEDYLEDFKDEVENYKEKKTVFNILKAGHTPSDFGGPTFFRMLKEGFNYNSNVIKRRSAEEILEIDCDLGRYNLRLELRKVPGRVQYRAAYIMGEEERGVVFNF